MRPPEETVDVESESALVGRLRAGDPEAVAALFDAHVDRIHAHCRRLLGDRTDAEDATAQTFLEVWRHRARVREHDGSALPWLYGVATNVCRNASRGHRRHQRAVGRLAPEMTHPDHADAVTDRVTGEQRVRDVLAAIARLPQRERDVVALVAWTGLSYEQAATALDVPVGTVRSRLSRARRRLATLAPEGLGA